MVIQDAYAIVADGDQLNDGYFNSLGMIPIGAVIPWLKSFTNTPALENIFVECNGQILSDADSVYNGQTIPDLNGFTGTQRFMRGGGSSDGSTPVTSGATGGNDTQTLSHSNDTGTDTYSTDSPNAFPNNHTNVDMLPSYYEVSWIMRVK